MNPGVKEINKCKCYFNWLREIRKAFLVPALRKDLLKVDRLRPNLENLLHDFSQAISSKAQNCIHFDDSFSHLTVLLCDKNRLSVEKMQELLWGKCCSLGPIDLY